MGDDDASELDNMLTAGGYAAYASVVGDFTGSGQGDRVVAVAAGNWDTTSADPATAKGAHAGIYLYVTNPTTDQTSSVKPLLSTSAFIGNSTKY